jgi:chromosome segregation ATPase
MSDDLAPQHDAPLTAPEAEQLSELEAVIERGFQTFLEVGAALAAVRDARLYRAEYATFEDYCQERWGMTRRNANHLIGAAGVVETLGTTVPKPTNERQARALGKVPEAERPEVWQEARERSGGKPTAKLIEQIASERTQQASEQPAPEAAPAAPRAAPASHPDTAPDTAPETAQQSAHSATPLEVAELQQRLQAAMDEIKDLKAQVSNLHTANDSELAQMNDTIARLQGRAASLEGENERLREEEAKARAELDRACSRLAQQDHPALQQQLDLTRRRFAAIKTALKQSEGARQRTQSLLDERRGGQMQPHARVLLDALEAIEKEVL